MKTIIHSYKGTVQRTFTISDLQFTAFSMKLYTELGASDPAESTHKLIKSIENHEAPVMDSPVNCSRFEFLED